MQKASAQAERAGKIIRRVREFVKKSEPRRQPVALAGIVEDAIGFVEIDARRHGAQVLSQVPADLPPVFADAVMIEQVVLNLVKNGIEAMRDTPADERIVTVSARRRDGQVEVSVADRGHGLSDEARERLFSPFYTTKAEGMGMGLNICRSIVEFHEGRLWVDANPAGGCIFRFTLPLETSVKPQAPTPEQIIYLVDDDEALRDSLVWLLESQGFKVEAFASAEDFLRAWRPEFNGCLLLDVRMPGMSGLELHERLRAQYCTLPVIFITGHGDVPMAVAALKKGAVDFIEKPFNDAELLRLVSQCLAKEQEPRRRRQDAEVSRRLDQLTQREREVLDLIIAGKLNKQIADVLGISIKTVEVHRARVMEKMAAQSLAELVQNVMAIEGSR
jgi:RNA polymerase sigma factor (sigma-70 family)